MYLAIRLRGGVKSRRTVKDTLKYLRMNRKMHAVLLKDNDVNKGMLNKARSWITWGEVDDSIIKILIKKRGRKPGNKRLEDKEVEEVFKKVKDEEKIPEEIKPVFRLTPPSKGFKKSIKQHYPNGELGYRGKEINKLAKRMI
jgi:large subunit ribosomal protein L30